MDLAIVLEFSILIFIFGFGFIVFRKIIPSKAFKQIRADELQEILDDDKAILIEVRRKSQLTQFQTQVINNIPLSQIKKAATDILNKNAEIVVISQTGAGGNEACKRIKRKGFTNLTNVQGGMSSTDMI